MQSALDTITRLRRIVPLLLKIGEAELAERLCFYLDSPDQVGSLDAALGLAVRPGGEPWWRTEGRRLRDRALCELAVQFHSRLPIAQQAAVIKHQIRRYESTAWLRDRDADQMPAHYVGTERAWLFRALKAAPVPSSLRQLRTILGDGSELADFIATDHIHPDYESAGSTLSDEAHN